jgi:hypothetical protein
VQSLALLFIFCSLFSSQCSSQLPIARKVNITLFTLKSSDLIGYQPVVSQFLEQLVTQKISVKHQVSIIL